MKRNIYHIACAWVLLICFVAGQYMVYAHRHGNTSTWIKMSAAARKVPGPRTVVKEKCYLCDVMHQNAMLASYQVYLNPVRVTAHVYKSGDYSFTSIQLILAAGRAPPALLA